VNAADLASIDQAAGTATAPVYIYALLDPDTLECRYIGKSIRPVERVKDHMNDAGACHRVHWIQSLKSRGLVPDMVILERVSGEWPWQESERFWIAYGRSLGWPLTNNTVGGDGVEGLPAETRERMAAVWRGRKHSEETRRKIGASWAHRTVTGETRAKMSAAHSGRVITWGAAISEATRRLTPEQESNIRARLAGGAKVVDLATEFSMHRTTISKVKKGTYR
jgi:hypothetical protein